MEKIYVTPEMEITEFETEDVIITSGGGIPTGDEGYDGGSGTPNWGYPN